MKLSRTVVYAIQASLQLAQAPQDAPTPCSQLAAKGKMPERFLLQILRNLVTSGILESTRGVEGGYKLKRGPEAISLLEIIEAIDGPLQATSPQATGLPAAAQRRLHSVLEKVAAQTRDQLGRIRLADLLKA
jgi:Rrf2 family protein